MSTLLLHAVPQDGSQCASGPEDVHKAAGADKKKEGASAGGGGPPRCSMFHMAENNGHIRSEHYPLIT